MRVLHVLEPADGGVAGHVRDLVRGQIERGHTIEAIVPERGRLAADLRALGAGVLATDLRPEITAVRSDLRATRLIAGRIRHGRWDVVHTHGNKAGTLARPLAGMRGLPVVHTPHSFAYASQLHRPRPGQAARRVLTLNIERACSRFARVIVCVSEAERAEAIRDRVAPPARFVVVPNGVAAPPDVRPDPRLARGGGEGDGDGVPVVGFLARLHEQKAPLLLLDALAGLHRRGVAFHAVLVGDGPLEPQVRERAAERELAGRVIVLPFPGDPWPVLAGFDVYVLPSLWESLPIGVLEAMAMGLPVIAADTGGVGEAVLDGQTGLLHAPGDLDGLIAALERLLGDPDLRASMGAAGHRRQTTSYSLEGMVAGVERAYELALSF